MPDAETVWSASAASRGEGASIRREGELRALESLTRSGRSGRPRRPPRSGERDFLTFHNKARAKFA